jgi:TonB-dependent SusC/RagA subfamily outer membrane receptor
MKPKLKLLLLPYIAISLGLNLIYCFTCWLLFIKLHKSDVDEELINFWLPFILPWIPVLIWLRPQIKKLRLNRTGRRSPDFLYMMIAAIGIAVPLIIAMTYMESATGKLTSLSYVNQIKNCKATKFYTFKNYFADKEDKSIEFTSHVTGRYNSELDLDIYVAVPLYDSGTNSSTVGITKITPNTNDSDSITTSSIDLSGKKNPLIILDGKPISREELSYISPDSIQNVSVLKGNAATALYGEDGKNGVVLLQRKRTPKEQPAAWLGIHYGKEISNYSSQETKNEIENDFFNESLNLFQVENLTTYSYFDRIPNSESRRYFRTAVSKSAFGNISSKAIILEPKYGDFNSRTGNEFPWIFGAFAIALVVWLIMILIPKIDEGQLNKPGERISISAFGKYLKFLMPRDNYYITPIIIDINIFVFLAMVFSGLGFLSFDAGDLLKWGANYSSYTIDDQWWRLLSCTFVHAGLIHLLSNMFALFFIGLILEPIIGKKTFAISYLVSGIMASITSVFWHDNIISVGASGAIFGLYGIFLALLLTKSVAKDLNKAFLTSTLIFIGYNLAMGFANSVIDNAAHIGGLITGLLIGFFLSTSAKENFNSI